jgi:hypothetical protein
MGALRGLRNRHNHNSYADGTRFLGVQKGQVNNTPRAAPARVAVQVWSSSATRANIVAKVMGTSNQSHLSE